VTSRAGGNGKQSEEGRKRKERDVPFTTLRKRRGCSGTLTEGKGEHRQEKKKDLDDAIQSEEKKTTSQHPSG